MEDSASSERLKRLVDSGLFATQDATEYVTRLRELTDDIIRTRETVRRVSRNFKALSHPTRLKILRLLSVRDMCVCEIMAILNATQPTISHHLNILKNIGLIEERREGKWIFYSLKNKRIMELVKEFERKPYP